MPNIFISYRREDAGGHAGRLCDRLTARFGDEHVFMDLQDIAPGQNFATSIDERIATCDCVLAVIGPRWVEAIQKRGAGAEDFVQHEISAALRRGVTLIPVLVGGARMPAAEYLPPAMSALRYRNALEIRDERFDDDVALLGNIIEGRRSKTALIAPLAGAIAVAAAVIAAYLLFRSGTTTTQPPPTLAQTTTTSPATTAVSVAPRATDLDGEWIAEMQKEGQPPFTTRLTFVVTGDAITGIVRYPTGDAPILEARLAGNVLTFHTSHVPQFESTPAIIRYQAAVAPGEIRLTTTDAYGIARGVARRRAQAGPASKVNPRDGDTYVWISPGRFVMGCSSGDPACDKDEAPSRSVEIPRGFWLGRTEVTAPSYRARGVRTKKAVATSDALPVTAVSWAAAKAYCEAIGGRLPTEAEWEYAARAGATTRHYASLPSIAWFSDNSGEAPQAVGKKAPNGFGLHDMLGNVSEWVLDRYYNAYDETSDPIDVEQPLAGNASAVARGGSWTSEADGVRVSRRLAVPPDAEEPHIGFRCAIDGL